MQTSEYVWAITEVIFSYRGSPQVKMLQKVLGSYFFDTHCVCMCVSGLSRGDTLCLYVCVRTVTRRHTVSVYVCQDCHEATHCVCICVSGLSRGDTLCMYVCVRTVTRRYVSTHRLQQRLSRSMVDKMISYREYTMTLTSRRSMLTWSVCLTPEHL